MPHKDIQTLINNYRALSSYKSFPKKLKDVLSSHKLVKSPLSKCVKFMREFFKFPKLKSTDYEIVVAFKSLRDIEIDPFPILTNFAKSDLIKGCQLLEEQYLFTENNFQLLINESHRSQEVSFLKVLEKFKWLGLLEAHDLKAQENYELLAKHPNPVLVLKILMDLKAQGVLVDVSLQKFFEFVAQPEKVQKFINLLHILNNFNLLSDASAKENLKIAVLADFDKLYLALQSQEATFLMMGSHGDANYKAIASHASPLKLVRGLFVLRDFGLLHGIYANSNRELMFKHNDPLAFGQALRLLKPTCENAQNLFNLLVKYSAILFQPEVNHLWGKIPQITPEQRNKLISLCARPPEVAVLLLRGYLKKLISVGSYEGHWQAVSRSPALFFHTSASSKTAYEKDSLLFKGRPAKEL